MQGGHGESLHPLGFMIGRGRSCTEEESGYESEISLQEDLTLGKRLDGIVHSFREIVGVILAWPIVLCCGYSTIYRFRKHKLGRVTDGTNTVLTIQQYRNAALDVYFQAFLFCAEEEFYLLMLPILIWNVDYALGRRLTLVVCIGLLLGNFVKDVFRLPRPKSPPVWRPAHGEVSIIVCLTECVLVLLL